MLHIIQILILIDDTVEDLNNLVLLTNQLGHACSKITTVIHHFLYAKNLPVELPGYGLAQYLVAFFYSTILPDTSSKHTLGAPPPEQNPNLQSPLELWKKNKEVTLMFVYFFSRPYILQWCWRWNKSPLHLLIAALGDWRHWSSQNQLDRTDRRWTPAG